MSPYDFLIPLQFALCACCIFVLVYIYLCFSKNTKKKDDPLRDVERFSSASTKGEREEEKVGIVLPKICIGGFCVEGKDIQTFVDFLENKYAELDEHIKSMEEALRDILGDDKTVRQRLQEVDDMRAESVSKIEDELRNISITRRQTVDEFKKKIEELETERKKSAEKINELVQKRVR